MTAVLRRGWKVTLIGALLINGHVFAAASSQPFGRLADGTPAHLFTLRQAGHLEVGIADYGGTVVRLLAPDRQGELRDVVLGFDSVESYVEHPAYFGALVGRVANRIAGGRFSLDGETFTLATNNAPAGQPCQLHGGLRGFDKVIWEAALTTRDGQPALLLHLTSPDGDQGFPGAVTVEVLYSLTADHGLRIDYSAQTTRPTPINLTNHTYFNLAGEGEGTVLDHELRLQASRYTPVTPGLIPTGELAPVAGTPFDFTSFHSLGERIALDNEQLRRANGYDHNFVIDAPGGALVLAATVYEPGSGRCLEVLTTEPGVQLYTANFLKGDFVGKSGKPYLRRGGFCLETQHFPDSVHQPDFPSTVLRPGQTFHSTTIYRFSSR